MEVAITTVDADYGRTYVVRCIADPQGMGRPFRALPLGEGFTVTHEQPHENQPEIHSVVTAQLICDLGDQVQMVEITNPISLDFGYTSKIRVSYSAKGIQEELNDEIVRILTERAGGHYRTT